MEGAACAKALRWEHVLRNRKEAKSVWIGVKEGKKVDRNKVR